jgi:hypothetical protein
MPVESQHPDFCEVEKDYIQISDCLAGHRRIKAKGDLYLPRPNADDESEENLERYKAYKKRAVFHAVTARTVSNMVGQCFSVDALRTTAQQGKNIKRVNTVTLSASTGTAGNFGFTFTRPRAYIPTQLANLTQTYDWAQLGLPGVPNGACLFFMVVPSTTSSGTLRGGGKIIHG